MSSEKIESQHVEEKKDSSSKFRHVENANEEDPELLTTFEEKRLIRKLDRRILP